MNNNTFVERIFSARRDLAEAVVCILQGEANTESEYDQMLAEAITDFTGITPDTRESRQMANQLSLYVSRPEYHGEEEAVEAWANMVFGSYSGEILKFLNQKIKQS